MPRVVIIAGELSGDRLGAGLIHALRARRPDLQVEGIAGPLMRAAGCRAWRDSEELAVMGLVEVLRHLPRLRGCLRDTLARLRADPPDVLVGVDAPDFNLRVERRARALGIRTVHYVSPSVWAWRAGRVRTLRAACDRVLCLLPFEPGFLATRGVAAEFVGHPLADEIPAGLDAQQARAELGLTAGPVVGLLPGSRLGEIQRLGPAFIRTAAWLAARRPGLQFAVPLATPAVGAAFRAQLAAVAPGLSVACFDGHAREVMAASDSLLVASGTATLEAMLVNRPMVVAYRLAPATYWLARSLRLVRLRHFSLPNLLAGRALVPEFLQDEVRAERLGPAVLESLDATGLRDTLRAEFARLRGELARGASEHAAAAVLEVAGLA